MSNIIAGYSHLKQQKAEYLTKIIRPLEESRKRLYNENPRNEERIAGIEERLVHHYNMYNIIEEEMAEYEKDLTETPDLM